MTTTTQIKIEKFRAYVRAYNDAVALIALGCDVKPALVQAATDNNIGTFDSTNGTISQEIVEFVAWAKHDATI
jgi:hypothetical protein